MHDAPQAPNDLLHDPLIGVRTPAGERRLSLPELLAALSAGEVEGYTGLRAHQADPWHVFLVQLAASIQARRPTTTLPTAPAYWGEGLLDLAGGKASAWHLLVEDVTQPAFMQHPWMSWEAEAADYGVSDKRGQTSYAPKATTPDELDVLVTAKNHDVKRLRVLADEAEQWIYALMCYQTCSGYNGAGNYGSIRLNGNYGSRSIVAWVEDRHPAKRFANEVHALLSLRQKVIRLHGFQDRGVVLTWLESWNRQNHQYTTEQLEPWFIEAVRPVRLRPSATNKIIALGATTKARQIGPKDLDNGDVGDPWTPIKSKDGHQSALDITTEHGFPPHLIIGLLFRRNFNLSLIQEPKPSNSTGWFVASSLAREKQHGNTKGFHRLELPVPPKAKMSLRDQTERDHLGRLATTLLDDTKKAQTALSFAIEVLLIELARKMFGTDETLPKNLEELIKSKNSKEKKQVFERVRLPVETIARQFTKRWEQHYFPTLWRGADEDHEAVRHDWQQRLVDEAHALLDEAAQRLPLPANRTWRALIQAERAFYGLLRKHELPFPNRTSASVLETMEEATP